jgi:hypothetical protein
MTILLTFWTSLDALLDASDLDFFDVNGVRIFPVRDGDEWLTQSCVVLRNGKNIRFSVNDVAARQNGYEEAKRIMAEIEAAAKRDDRIPLDPARVDNLDLNKWGST